MYVTYNVLSEQTQKKKQGITHMFSGGCYLQKDPAVWVKVIGLHVSAIASRIRVRKDALPAAEKKDMELFQKWCPPWAKKVWGFCLGHPHALTYRGTCVAESFLSMLVWSQNLRRWQIHFGHSYSRPWNIWKVKGWTGILLHMFSQHYQDLETRSGKDVLQVHLFAPKDGHLT